MTDEYLRNIRQLDLACRNRDLAAAKRLTAAFIEMIHPGEPIDIWRVGAMVRTYAAEIHGWEIE